ncbi:MAG: transporter substrate-binding domain-containing protein [Alphaproteobacteria bacterium]|nr:transporter substrate-binding domain-containing protein [Alphaproteobacteria bacterium]
MTKLRHIVMAASLTLAGVFGQCHNAAAGQSDSLRIATIAVPPFVSVDPNTDNIDGIGPEAVRKIAAQCGMEVSFVISPSWARAYMMAVSGTVDGIIPTTFSEERATELDFHPATLFDAGPSLMVRADSGITGFGSLQQLEGQRLAVQQNILLEPKFDTFIRGGKVDLYVRANATALVEELLSGKVDYIADTYSVLEHHLGRPDVLSHIRVLEPKVGIAPRYLALSKARRELLAPGTPLSRCLIAARP